MTDVRFTLTPTQEDALRTLPGVTIPIHNVEQREPRWTVYNLPRQAALRLRDSIVDAFVEIHGGDLAGLMEQDGASGIMLIDSNRLLRITSIRQAIEMIDSRLAEDRMAS